MGSAIEAMQQNGIDQWDGEYPTESVILLDVEAGSLHVLTKDNDIWAFVTIDENTSPEWNSVDWRTGGKVLSVHRLAVDPRMQCNGLATRLLIWVEEFAASRGYDAIHLDAFSENPAALRLYEKLDYRRAGIVRFRKGNFICYEKAVS